MCIRDSYMAYLKIAEGCDNCCSYCIIPKLRGPYVSKPFEQVLGEAKALVDKGVKELIVGAQDTTLSLIHILSLPSRQTYIASSR